MGTLSEERKEFNYIIMFTVQYYSYSINAYKEKLYIADIIIIYVNE